MAPVPPVPSTVSSRPPRVRQAVLSRLGLVSLAAGTLLTLSAGQSRAAQFVLLDATFDYTWDDAMNAKPNKSHFYVNEGNFLNKERPKNWLSPVDYRNGTLHVRAEVFKKPAGTQTTGWTLCYIANSGGYGCADTDYYKSTGIFEREVKMTEFWNNTEVQWAQGVKQIDLIYAINDSGSGHITNYPALKDLTTPTSVRITMVQVSAGSTYDPSLIPGLGADGGTVAGTGGAGVTDAPTTTDDGSVSGSGGATSPAMDGAVGGATGGGGDPGTPPPAATGGSTGASSGSGGHPGLVVPPSTKEPDRVGGTCAVAAANGPGALAALGVLGLLFLARRRGRRQR